MEGSNSPDTRPFPPPIVTPPPSSPKKRQLSPTSSVEEPATSRPWRSSTDPNLPTSTQDASIFSTPPAKSSQESSSDRHERGIGKLNYDCLQIIFNSLSNKDLANFARAGSSKCARFVRAYLGLSNAVLVSASESEPEIPEHFSIAEQVGDQLVVLEVEKEAGDGVRCWFSDVSSHEGDARVWRREEVVIGALLSPWKGFNCCASSVVGTTIYIFGGRSPPISRFREAPEPTATTTDSQDSSEVEFTITSRMFAFDTVSLELREIGVTSFGDQGSSQGSSSSRSARSSAPGGSQGSNHSSTNNTPNRLPLHSRASLAASSPGSTSTPSHAASTPRSNASDVHTAWPPELMCHSMNSLSDRWLVVFGGCRARSEGENDVYIYDLDTSSWSAPRVEGGLPPSRRFSHASCVGPNGEIYIYGGAFFDFPSQTYNDLHALVMRGPHYIYWTKFLVPTVSRPSPSLSSGSQSQSHLSSHSQHHPMRRHTGSTESLASTQLASQNSKWSQASLAPEYAGDIQRSYASVAAGPSNVFVTPPVAGSASSATTASLASLSSGGVLRTTGYRPRYRSGAKMLLVGSSRLVIIGGREVLEVSAPKGGEWEGAFPRSWAEACCWGVEGIDVFELNLRHWSEVVAKIAVESKDVGTGKGKEKDVGVRVSGKKEPLFFREVAVASVHASGFRTEMEATSKTRILLTGYRLNLDRFTRFTSPHSSQGTRHSSPRSQRSTIPPARLPLESTSEAFETMKGSFSQDLPPISAAPFSTPRTLLRPHESHAFLPRAMDVDYAEMPPPQPSSSLMLPPRPVSPDVFSSSSSLKSRSRQNDPAYQDFLFCTPEAGGDGKASFVTRAMIDEGFWLSSFEARSVDKEGEMGTEETWLREKVERKRWEGWLDLE